MSKAPSLWLKSSRVSSRLATPAGFHSTSSPVPRRPVTALPIPTARAPMGRSRNSAPSEAAPSRPLDRAWGSLSSSPATMRRDTPSCAVAVNGAPKSAIKATSAAGLEGFGFIDQHDRDTVLNIVAQPARMAQEGGFFLPVLQLAPTLRADQHVE